MRHLPNILTSINLLCGCLAIVALQNNTPYLAYGFFFIALVMDFLDGMVARLLNAYSELGKQLDSLADMVSFGVFPGFLWLKLFENSNWHETATMVLIVSFLFTLAVALRLAKFNIDERQSSAFLGLPSPAAALFVLGFFHWVSHYPKNIFSAPPVGLNFDNLLSDYHIVFQQPWILVITLIAISTMMLVEIPMFSLKIKQWRWAGNEIKIIFVLLSIVLLLIFQLMALPLIIILFILISVVHTFLKPKMDN